MKITVLVSTSCMTTDDDGKSKGGRRTSRPDEGREGRGKSIKELKVHLRIPLLLSTAVDHCFSSPCANNGTCNNSLHGYRCLCPEGFTGSLCEEGKTTVCLFVFTKMIQKKREILELLFIMPMLRTTTTTTTTTMMIIIVMMMTMVDLRGDGQTGQG